MKTGHARGRPVRMKRQMEERLETRTGKTYLEDNNKKEVEKGAYDAAAVG